MKGRKEGKNESMNGRKERRKEEEKERRENGAGAMAHSFPTLAGSIPSTCIGQLTTAWKPMSKASEAIFQSLLAPRFKHMCHRRHTDIYIILKTIKTTPPPSLK